MRRSSRLQAALLIAAQALIAAGAAGAARAETPPKASAQPTTNKPAATKPTTTKPVGGKPTTPKPAPVPPTVSLNQDFVRSLTATVDLKKPRAVFALVFATLPDTVTVYPSENYFYWHFNANGKAIWGNFRLDAADRDRGVLNLGYFEYDENGKFQDYKGGDAALSAKDGVIVTRVDAFTYTVAHAGKTVTFKLFRDTFGTPKKSALRADERYVGPVFDESGIRFHLIFSEASDHFYFVLNEDVPVTETFRPMGKDILIGRRSGFAFYVDAEQKRKILVGVYQLNVRRNNYYDGPFDQMPDNFVDRSSIKTYLERAYPDLKGRLDKFGHFTDTQGTRAAAFSYFIYTDEQELDFVRSCAASKLTRPKFLACITPDGR